MVAKDASPPAFPRGRPLLPPNHDLRALHRAVDDARPQLVQFLQHLVQIPSLPGQEHDAHRLVANRLADLGLHVHTLPCDPQQLAHHPAFNDDGVESAEPRINVIAKWHAHDDDRLPHARSLILNGHLDVVSPGDEVRWKDSPWSGVVRDGRLYGRGSCDMKAGVSVAVFAMTALRAVGFRPGADITVETVSGEESGGIGTLSTVVNGFAADAAIVLEPTKLQICPVQSGALTFRVRVLGRSIHACMRSYGVSAIDNATQLLAALADLDRRRHHDARQPLFADPFNVAPISIGTIRGGAWHSTVPDEVVLEGRCGVFPGESIADAKASLETTIAAAADQDPWMRVHRPDVEWFEGQFESAMTPVDTPLVHALSRSHHHVTGGAPELAGVTYGSDLRFFTNCLGIPALLYGPGDVADAHTVDESIDIDSVVTATKVVSEMVVRWCGNGELA